MFIRKFAQKMQGADRCVPLRWRLPLRHTAQSLFGAIEAELSALPGFLGDVRGKTAIDIGANIGIYTYALHKLGLNVQAFEPQPACAAVISAWARGRPGIIVHNCGVGATDGHLLLHVPVAGGRAIPTRASFHPSGPDDLTIRVPVVVLDTIALDNVEFIKIDVEGYEFEVLRGSSAVLDRFHPKLLIEIDRSRHSRASFMKIIDYVTRKGYRCRTVQEDGSLMDNLQPWDAPGRIYNFLFSA